MLYKSAIVESEDIDFLFDVDIYNEDIDIREVAAIQGFYEKHGYIPDNHIVTFLNWLTYSARKNISNELEDVTKSSFAGRCAVAQSSTNTIYTQIITYKWLITLINKGKEVYYVIR